jgi:hypothetical protein
MTPAEWNDKLTAYENEDANGKSHSIPNRHSIPRDDDKSKWNGGREHNFRLFTLVLLLCSLFFVRRYLSTLLLVLLLCSVGRYCQTRTNPLTRWVWHRRHRRGRHGGGQDQHRKLDYQQPPKNIVGQRPVVVTATYRKRNYFRTLLMMMMKTTLMVQMSSRTRARKGRGKTSKSVVAMNMKTTMEKRSREMAALDLAKRYSCVCQTQHLD